MITTPGPWSAALKDTEIGDCIDVMSGGVIIATVLGADAFPCLEDQEVVGFDLVTRANAHLIAASPSMLKALEYAEGHLAETLADNEWHPIGHCPVLDAVRAAIASAKGVTA